MNLDTYAWQYNTGAHQSLGGVSPFSVFYGRNSRGYISAFELLPTCQDVKVDPNSYKEWKKDIEEITKQAEENQKNHQTKWF